MHMNIGEKSQLPEGKSTEEADTHFSLEEKIDKIMMKHPKEIKQ